MVGGCWEFFYCMECEQDGRGEPWRAFSDMHLFRRLNPTGGLIVGDADEATDYYDGIELLSARRIVAWDPVVDHPSLDEADGLSVEWAVELHRRTGKLGNHRLTWESGQVAFEFIEPPEIYATATGGPAGGDKLGGWPAWVQSPEWPHCPSCGGRMRLVFQLGSNDNLDFMFGDAGRGHVFGCGRCDEFAFNWSCF